MSYGHKFTATDKLVKIDDKEIHAFSYTIENHADSFPVVTVEFCAYELDVEVKEKT